MDLFTGEVAAQSLASSGFANDAVRLGSRTARPTHAQRRQRQRAALHAAVSLCHDQTAVIKAMGGAADEDLSARLLALAPVLRAQRHAPNARAEKVRSS